jgi:hypothetical protein
MASISNDSTMKLYEYLKEHKSYTFKNIDMFKDIKIGTIEFEIINDINLVLRIYDYHFGQIYLYCEILGEFTTLKIFEGYIKHLNHLKFNKLIGKFQYNIIPDFGNVLSNTTFKYKECCVCLENTTTKLKCDHYICYECKSQLQKNKCPMCRKGFCICDMCEDCNIESESESESESDDE